MTGPWITDIRHFLDEQGRVPDDLPAVPRYMGAIVVAASPLSADRIFPLDLQCRRRPGHERCLGSVHAGIDSESAEISWFCPCCGDQGRIHGWQGSPWDRRAPHFIPIACAMDGPAGFSPRATAAWNTIAPEIRVRLLNNFWCGVCHATRSVDLHSGSISQGDLVLRGYCTRCGGEIARLIENVGRTQKADMGHWRARERPL
jgi:hypothetical protein